jgi:hypothetical protein
MKFQVTAERSTVYEVEADNAEEAIDKMIEGDAVEIDGCTHSINAARLWEEDDPHGPTCAIRFAAAAECTCGKADALASREAGQ